MAPGTQYVFAETLGISEHFTAGSHEWLPYSVFSTFPKQTYKHQFAEPYVITIRFIHPTTNTGGTPMRNKVALLLSAVLMTLLPVSVRATELIPFTGDEFQMTTWIVLMAVSLAAVLVLVFLMLKKKK